MLRENAADTAPPVTLIDTTGRPVEETAAQVAAWIRAHAGTSRVSGGRM